MAINDLRIISRDKNAFLLLLLMPLVLIFILGMVFGPLWSEENPMGQVQVALVDEDGGPIAQAVRQGLDQGPFAVTNLSSPTETSRQVQEGKYAGAIILPAHFSSRLMAGQSASIQVLGDPAQKIKAQVVKQGAERIGAEIAKRQLALRVAMAWVKDQGLAIPDARAVGSWLNQLEPLAQSQAQSGGIVINRRAVAQEAIPRAMDYYAAAMLVMYILFTVSTASGSFLEDMHNGTMVRLSAFPLNRWQLLGGKLLGVFLVGAIQMAILIAFSALLFQVNWGQSLAGLILLLAASLLAASGLGILIASLSKTAGQSGNLSAIIILCMSLLGGSMWPLFIMPKWFMTINAVTINRWAMDGFMDLMFYGAGAKEMLRPAAVLLAMGLVYLGLGIWQMGRRWRSA